MGKGTKLTMGKGTKDMQVQKQAASLRKTGERLTKRVAAKRARENADDENAEEVEVVLPVDAQRAALLAQKEALQAQLDELDGAPKKKKYKSLAAKVSPSVKPDPPTVLDDGVKEKVTEYTKLIVYRSHKFMFDDEDHEKEICRAVWNHFHKEQGWEAAPYNLDVASFTHLYAPVIKSALSAQRQYSQSKGKGSAASKYFCWLLGLTLVVFTLTCRVQTKPLTYCYQFFIRH